MAKIADAALDAGIGYIITHGTKLALCSQEPATFGDVATYRLAEDGTVTCGAAGDGTPSGRKTTVPACDCVASANGTATHWALYDGSVLAATGSLNASIAITSGITYPTTSFDITIKDAVSA